MSTQQSPRRPTNLSLDADLIQEARSFGVNLSQAAQAGVRRAVAEAKAEQWHRDNAEAVDNSNRWVEASGRPLDRSRLF